MKRPERVVALQPNQIAIIQQQLTNTLDRTLSGIRHASTKDTVLSTIRFVIVITGVITIIIRTRRHDCIPVPDGVPLDKFQKHKLTSVLNDWVCKVDPSKFDPQFYKRLIENVGNLKTPILVDLTVKNATNAAIAIVIILVLIFITHRVWLRFQNNTNNNKQLNQPFQPTNTKQNPPYGFGRKNALSNIGKLQNYRTIYLKVNF